MKCFCYDFFCFDFLNKIWYALYFGMLFVKCLRASEIIYVVIFVFMFFLLGKLSLKYVFSLFHFF